METEFSDATITDIVTEINDSPLSKKFELLAKLFNESVREKWYDEIYQTNGSAIEITDEQKLRVLGKLLRRFAENDGKL
jgi:hypothetical protein